MAAGAERLSGTIGRIRAILRCAALAALALAAAGGDARPNVVVILFDDLGWPEAPLAVERGAFRMPNLERLAREGMRFTDAHSASAVCTPTRYGLLTGQCPFRIRQWGVIDGSAPSIIAAGRPTLATLLRGVGYRTGCFGKWHLGMILGKVGAGAARRARGKQADEDVPAGTPVAEGPLAHGFERFFGFTHARDIGTLISDDRVHGTREPVEVQGLCIDEALTWIGARARARERFLAYIPLATPHKPWVPAPEFGGKGGGPEQGDYADWIFQGDAMVGRILDALDALGVARDTLVVVSSDNGQETRVMPPLRGKKRMIWEGGHRVPFVARWPGVTPPGSTCARTISLNDIFRTAAVAGGATVPADAGEDSVDIGAYLRGRLEADLRPVTLMQSSSGDIALRAGPLKLVQLADGGRQLFDLGADLAEGRNLAGERADDLARLVALLQATLSEGRSTPGPARRAHVPRFDGGERDGPAGPE